MRDAPPLERAGLPDPDDRLLHLEALENGGGDGLGNGLDQVKGARAHDLHGQRTHRFVVDGRAQVVRRSSGGEVEAELDVDHELLGPRALLVAYADARLEPEIRDEDAVHVSAPGQARRTASTTSTTRFVSRTSCTLTMAAPFITETATAASVPSSRSAAGSALGSEPRNDLRDGPTRTG